MKSSGKYAPYWSYWQLFSPMTDQVKLNFVMVPFDIISCFPGNVDTDKGFRFN